MSTSTTPGRFEHRADFVTKNWNGSIRSQSLDAGSTFIWTDSISKGGPVSGYRKIISEGGCATTQLSGTKVLITAVPTFAESESYIPGQEVQTGSRYNVHGHWGNPGTPGTGLDTSYAQAENRSLSSFYSNLAATETKFKGMVFSGELRESLRTLRSPFSSLRKGISDYLSSVKRRAPRTPKPDRLKMVGDTWLEYAFGWKPLISDIDKATTAFYTSDVVRPTFEMVRGFGQQERIENVLVMAHVGNYGNLRLRQNRHDEVITYVKHYGTYHSTGHGVNNIHRYGFAPWEFIPTIWELIPYSFLVDYFTNAGKILESWSYRTLGPNFVSRGVKRTAVRIVNYHIEVMKSNAPWVDVGTVFPGSYRYQLSAVERTPQTSVLVPSLELKVPGQWSKWANLAALSTQLESVRKVLLR